MYYLEAHLAQRLDVPVSVNTLIEVYLANDIQPYATDSASLPGVIEQAEGALVQIQKSVTFLQEQKVTIAELKGQESATNAGLQTLDTGLSLGEAAVFGVVVGAAGQFADLCESLLKRSAAVKDSGSLVPEFGGMLDILDSPLLAAPVAYLLLAVLW